MNRDELYANWNGYIQNEIFIRNHCKPRRYKLLCEIRVYLESKFGIDIDESSIESPYFKELVRSGTELVHINNRLAIYNELELTPIQERIILGGIFYLIIFEEIDIDDLEIYIGIINRGLTKIIHSRFKELSEYDRRKEEETNVDLIISRFVSSLEPDDSIFDDPDLLIEL